MRSASYHDLPLFYLAGTGSAMWGVAASYPAMQHPWFTKKISAAPHSGFFLAALSTLTNQKPTSHLAMASVYKSVSKTSSKDSKDDDGTKRNKQRVLVLTSRGVTYRFAHTSTLVFFPSRIED